MLRTVAISTKQAWGIGGLLCLSLILSVIGFYLTMARPQQITAKNVKPLIERYLNTFHIGITQLPANPHFIFSIGATGKGARFILITNPKDYPNYLNFDLLITLAPDLQARLSQRSAQENDVILRDLRIALAQAKLDSESVGRPITTVKISKSIPITQQLTEDVFMDGLRDVEFGSEIVAGIIRRDVNESQAAHSQ
jgi:hypothetical protein